jgi:hypothetical protein
MTADESGLPPLDPGDIRLPEYNSGGELMKWLISTVLELPDVTDEQRDGLAEVVRRIEFNDIMKNVSADMVRDLMSREDQKLDDVLRWFEEHPNPNPYEGETKE